MKKNGSASSTRSDKLPERTLRTVQKSAQSRARSSASGAKSSTRVSSSKTTSTASPEVDFVSLAETEYSGECTNCGGGSGLVAFTKVSTAGRRSLVAVLDDECIAKALEISTGHAILNQLHQWNLMHVAAKEIGALGHASRRAQKQRDEREAAREQRRTQPFSGRASF